MFANRFHDAIVGGLVLRIFAYLPRIAASVLSCILELAHSLWASVPRLSATGSFCRVGFRIPGREVVRIF
jgi:hypothetical protein